MEERLSFFYCICVVGSILIKLGFLGIELLWTWRAVEQSGDVLSVIDR
jgi:hypothetical protein